MHNYQTKFYDFPKYFPRVLPLNSTHTDWNLKSQMWFENKQFMKYGCSDNSCRPLPVMVKNQYSGITPDVAQRTICGEDRIQGSQLPGKYPIHYTILLVLKFNFFQEKI